MPDNVRQPHSRDPDEPQRVPPHREGQTTPQKAERRADQQPHERDESSASQQGAPSELMEQARKDVESGLVDTSRAEATDATYGRELRPEPQAAHPADEHAPGEDRRLDTSGRPGRPDDPRSSTDKPPR